MKGMIALVISLLSFSCVAQTVSYDKQMSIEGLALDYTCEGEGDPVTVLEPPSGDPSERSFFNVFYEFSKTNKTCIYTRLGDGEDTRARGMNLTGWDYVKQLEELVSLEAAGRPLLLVGYSYGGFVAHLYASKYPDQVAGMLLLDPPHHEWLQRMKAEMSESDWAKIADIQTWFLEWKGHNVWDTQFEVAAAQISREMPVIIITRGLDHENISMANISDTGYRQFNDIHFRLQKDLEDLTEKTIRITAPESQHLILDYEPEIAIQAFRDLNEMIRGR